MRRSRIFFGLFLLLAVLALGWQLGVQMERQSVARQKHELEVRFALAGSGVTFENDPEQEVDLTLLWTVWRLLDQYYVDPDELTIDQLRYGAVAGLVEATGDSYTSFMTPQENNDFQQVLRGTLEGIGAELTMRDGAIVIVAPIKGTPAAKAGLLPLDVIISVDGDSMEGVSLEDAVHKIRGEKGTSVEIGIYRPDTNEELTFNITRDRIQVPSTDVEVIETGSGSVGFLSINQFADATVREAKEKLEYLLGQEIEGLILDLRFNGGGYLEGSIDITSLFLHRGKVVSVHRRGQELESHYVNGDVLDGDMPMVVLINEGSASASEIVAGALQDHERAIIMGAQSFGKGTVQEVIDLPGGSSLRVTVAKWQTPSGRVFMREGIVPDYIIPMNTADYLEGIDPQKDAAIEYLLDGDTPVVALEEKVVVEEESDEE